MLVSFTTTKTPMQSRSPAAVTCSCHLPHPGEKPSVREQKCQGQPGRWQPGVNLPLPLTSVLSLRPWLRKPSVWWEVLAEGCWWDAECGEPHMGP